LLISLSAFSFSQAEKLNQFDDKGKKDGKWILYLDSKWNKLKDSTTAVYCRYTYYDHGVHSYPMGAGGKKNWICIRMGDGIQKIGKMILLDGEYRWSDPKGRTIYIHTLKNGEYLSYKEYYESGELHEFFDYTKHFEGQPLSWYIYVYDKKGKVTYEGWTKKDEKGNWPVMRG